MQRQGQQGVDLAGSVFVGGRWILAWSESRGPAGDGLLCFGHKLIQHGETTFRRWTRCLQALQESLAELASDILVRNACEWILAQMP